MKIFILLLLVACAQPKPIPLWEGKLFVGDSTRRGLTRSQTQEFIPSDSPLFDNYISMSSEDFRSFYQTYVLGCQSWGSEKELSVRPYMDNLDAMEIILNRKD